MGLLDESLTPGQSGHIAHQEQVHKKLNALAVDVKADFGATGDGTTDDTAAIDAAIVAAAAIGAPVFFPAGTYIASTVLPQSNTALIGPGPIGTFGLSTYWGTRSAVIKQKASTAGPLISDVSSGSRSYGVRIFGLTIDGNKSNQSASNHGIELYDSSDPGEDPSWLIEDCLIRNCKGDGIHVGAWRRNNRIHRSEILDNDGDGIHFESTDNHVISCSVGNNVGVGIQVDASVTHILGCDIWGNDTNINVGSAAFGTMIANCGIDRADKDGLNIAGPETIVSGCSFTSNSQSSDGTYAHISLDMPNFTAIGCVITGATFSYDGSLSNMPSYGVETNLAVQVAGLGYDPANLPFTVAVVNDEQHCRVDYRTTAWTTPTLLNSWVDFGSGYQGLRWRKEGNSIEIEGTIKSGADPSVIFTLPAGARPAAPRLGLPGALSSDQSSPRIDVQTNGDVEVAATGFDVTTWLSLSLRFGLG